MSSCRHAGMDVPTNVNHGETNVITLLPCPFCGSRAHLYGDDYWFYWVECICCYCKVGYEETTEQGIGHVDSGRFRTEAEAIAAWNTRAERT